MRHMMTLFLGHFVADLFRHRLTAFLLYSVALFLGHKLCYRLLILLTPLHRHRAANFNVGRTAHFFGNSFRIGHILGTAHLFGHLFALGIRHSVAHLSGLIPTLFTWFIPALLLAIDLNTFFLRDCNTLPLSHNMALFLLDCFALLFILSVALLFLLVFSHRSHNSLTLSFGHLITFLFLH